MFYLLSNWTHKIFNTTQRCLSIYDGDADVPYSLRIWTKMAEDMSNSGWHKQRMVEQWKEKVVGDEP